jgi:hypothetical protein
VKLLNQYLERNDADEAGQLLRRAGIAVLVETMNPHSAQPSKTGATHVGLWILLGDQFDDAIRVLEDQSHVPRRVLSDSEIARLEKRAAGRVGKSRLLDKLLVLLLIVGLMGLILFSAADYFLGL